MLRYTFLGGKITETDLEANMNTKEKLNFIYKYMPGDLGDIAMMIPCHINTIRKIRSGDGNIRPIIKNRIDELYEKAKEIQEITENA